MNSDALGAEASRRLIALGTAVAPGFTPAELASVEARFGFTFADDHRAFLAAGAPVGGRWPDWRAGDVPTLDWPVEGVLFDVEHNDFWYDAWGRRPPTLDAALGEASRQLAQVPVMVPVYGHRYLPAGRGTFGHPVLSMYQTDIICYGANLADWVTADFGSGSLGECEPTVEFWRDLVQLVQ
jgi:hypothetical protein